MTEIVRIAMWSGPRNISTALMRSFSARGDTTVVDEPLYAHYLAETGLAHPGRDEVLAAQPRSWAQVAEQLHAIEDEPVVYVKHMAHHLLAGVDRGWLDGWRHAFLIRDPAAMLLSLDRVLDWTPRVADTGLDVQVEIAETLGGPVVAAEDVLADPAGTLEALCGALGLDWTDRMLSWPAGPHPADGVWAPHWYDAVRASTGFAAPRPPVSEEDVGEHLRDVLDACRPLHAALAGRRIGPASST